MTSGKILVTGFLPFGGRDSNPSQMLVEALAADSSFVGRIETAILPVSFRRAPEDLRRLLADGNFRAVLMFGLAEKRDKVSLERMALNWVESLSADEDGLRLAPAPLRVGAPPLYSSALPLDGWVTELKTRGIPAEVSLSAGGFVCNAVSFEAAGLMSSVSAPSLFVHLPLLPDQAKAGEASLPFKAMRESALFLIEKLERLAD